MAEYSQLHIHPVPYQQKPNKAQAAQISKTITQNVEVVTPIQLSDKLANGHSVVLGVLDGARLKENLIGQQVMMLDFDNTQVVNGEKVKVEGEDYVTIQDVLGSQWIQNHVAFIYKSFSYRDDWHKFRVVIFLDTILKDAQLVTDTYKWLMHRFPQADPATKDCSRIFYGGTEVIEVNFENKWTPQQLVAKEKQADAEKFKNVTKLSKRQSSQMMRGYIERERENLQEYGYALSAISVIGKAVLSGEIEEQSARKYVADLALDNEKWIKENEVKLNEFLGKRIEDIYTDYTFKDKFSAQGKEDEFDVFEFSQQLVRDYEVVYYKDKLYAKAGKVWQCDENMLLRTINSARALKRNQDREVLHQLEKIAPIYEGDVKTIQLANDYQLKDGEIIKGRLDEFTPYLLDVEYDPSAYNADVDNFLNFLVMDRPELRQTVEELLGHILLLRGFPHKVFFLVGEKGANGKSTFLEMLNNWTGDLGSNINLEAFNDPTSVSELEDKVVNIGDDIDASYLDKSMNFKTLASGNTIMIRPIYQRARKLKNTATLIFTANEMPTFRDKTGGIERRLAIIPCDNVVEEADFGMDEKLSTNNAKSYLLNIALEGLGRIQANGGQLTDSDIMKDILKDYLTEVDTIVGFIEEVGVNQDLDKSMVYQEYKKYCEDIGVKPQKMAALTRRLTSRGYRVQDTYRLGKRMFLYIKD